MKKTFLLSCLMLAAMPVMAAYTGHVYVDKNKNGVFDQSEKPLAGIKVSDGLNVVETAADGSFTLPRFPIPCGTVPACTAELSSRGEVFHHVIPWHYLSSKHFLFRRTCRQTNCLASCIHAENDRLNILSAPIEEPDSERHPFDNLCFLVIQKMTGFCRSK